MCIDERQGTNLAKEAHNEEEHSDQPAEGWNQLEECSEDLVELVDIVENTEDAEEPHKHNKADERGLIVDPRHNQDQLSQQGPLRCVRHASKIDMSNHLVLDRE